MRYFIELSYNGANYHGWQIQPNAISVEEKITHCISTILNEKIKIIGAGRTDTGVHAEQMFAHFDYSNKIEKRDFLSKINSFLPKDIYIKNIILVQEKAHARFDATKRQYKYHISNEKNPFCENHYFVRYDLDLDKMNKACEILLKTKDFGAFCKAGSDNKTTICDVKKAHWKVTENKIIFTISADRFLRNMVRSIVGTMIDIGQNKISLQDFEEIIKSKSRKKAGFSAPAKGLFLTRVSYPFIK